MQVYLVKLTDIAENFEYYVRFLSGDEYQRMQRFATSLLQRKFAVTRGFLRQTLGKHLDVLPQTLIFEYNQWGKPALREHSLQFNLAHSGEYCALAMSNDHAVGVDIEKCAATNLGHIEIAKRFFTKDEYHAIANSQNSERLFFHVWTQKEAFLKAIGRGLSFGMDRFEVSTDLDIAAILDIQDPRYYHHHWSSHVLRPDPNYQLVITIENEFEAFPAYFHHINCPIEKIG